ncbi:MAG: STAS domain-containing protein [Planctomycetota bacterium]|nr:STAS domain-containing protein [Planctomycetota bacterium]
MSIEFAVTIIQSTIGTKAARVEVSGGLDPTTLDAFKEVLEKLLAKGAKNVIVDCTRTKFISSSGLASLLNFTDRFEAEGGGMAITRAPHNVLRVIYLMGFDKHLNVFADDATALVWFTGVALKMYQDS